MHRDETETPHSQRHVCPHTLALKNAMKKKNFLSRSTLLLGSAFSLFCVSASAIDSASLEYGHGRKVDLVRAGVQWQWEKQWWQSNGTHIGGYWDLTLARWRASQFRNIPGNSKQIYDLGLTPVFRFQSDAKTGLYAELGIGIHYLNKLYDNNGNRLSTRFQFGDHLGVGYVFRNNLDIGLKVQHFSNGSIKKPNDGEDFIVLRVSYPF